MTAITDPVGHGVDLQFTLRRLEQQAATPKNGASK